MRRRKVTNDGAKGVVERRVPRKVPRRSKREVEDKVPFNHFPTDQYSQYTKHMGKMIINIRIPKSSSASLLAIPGDIVEVQHGARR